MWTRRVLRRMFKALLWCAVFVVLLSIGLRVYSAWQIPKAKRLLRDVSRLRAGQPLDNKLRALFSRYKFEKLDPEKCSAYSCEFATGMGATFPFWYEVDSHNLVDRAIGAGNRALVALGFCPWQFGINVLIVNGRIESVNYRLRVLDREQLMGVSTTFWGEYKLDSPNEDSPELTVGRYSSNAGRDIYIRFTPSADGLEAASIPDFSCVWQFRFCKSGYDLFPGVAALQLQIEATHARRVSSSDPCPSSNMPSRARDSKVLWFGEVKHSLGSNTAAVEVKKVLKVETREISLGPAEHVELSGSSRNLFPGGLSAGEEVIVTGSNDCPVLPSTERNVAMLNKWLDTYRPLWSDSLPDGPSLPQVRIPEGLR